MTGSMATHFLSTESYKGTRDFYPKDMQFRNWMFGKLSETVRRFGYLEYGGPMLESFDLYAAKTGEEIVNQQLYAFEDRGQRKVALRPEMTPTMARLVAGRIHELPRPVRLFSIPNLWRYERPQRGRLREHWQLNVDVLGGEALDADAEIIQLAVEIMNAFNGGPNIQVRVNHRELMDHFFSKKLGLTADQTHKVVKAIDAKDKIGPEKFLTFLHDAGLSKSVIDPLLQFIKADFAAIEKDLMDSPGVRHMSALFAMLADAGLKLGTQIVFDPGVMRGLDYYTGTVFEVYDTSPENPRAMFGGGRYDNLMGIFGKDSLSGVGFGMGDVTLQNFLETHKLVPVFSSEIDVMVALPKPEFRAAAQDVAKKLRADGFHVITPLSVGGFGVQLKLATKHEAKVVVLFGDDEFARGEVLLKNLVSGEQITAKIAEVAPAVKKILKRNLE